MSLPVTIAATQDILLSALAGLGVAISTPLRFGTFPEAWKSRGPLVVAHRGSSVQALENTLGAFRLARVHGADAIELDVRLCATGEVLVLHDMSPARVGGPDVRVSELSLAEVRKLSLRGGEPICTLEEVLHDPTVPALVNVEIKQETVGTDGIERAVAHVVRRCRAEDRVLVSSFNPLALARLPSPLARGMLYDHAAKNPLARRPYLAPLCRPQALHPHHSLVDARLTRFCAALGLAIMAWTVDEPEAWDRLVGLGVNGIITNVPDRLMAHLASKGLP